MNLNTRHLNDDPMLADIFIFWLHFAFRAQWLLLLLLVYFLFKHVQSFDAASNMYHMCLVSVILCTISLIW